METRAYNQAYLEDAMASLGAMMDYAVNVCGEALSLFHARFLASGLAEAFSQGNPKYIAGMSGIELAMLVVKRTGEALPDREVFIDMGSPEYWTGWTLAYLSWYLCMDFDALQSRGVRIEDLRDRYPVLHEAGLTKSVEFATGRIDDYQAERNLLKRARRNAGLTQRQLAGITGVPLRVIQSYEQGQRSLETAGMESVRRICRALGCRIEDIRPL